MGESHGGGALPPMPGTLVHSSEALRVHPLFEQTECDHHPSAAAPNVDLRLGPERVRRPRQWKLPCRHHSHRPRGHCHQGSPSCHRSTAYAPLASQKGPIGVASWTGGCPQSPHSRVRSCPGYAKTWDGRHVPRQQSNRPALLQRNLWQPQLLCHLA